MLVAGAKDSVIKNASEKTSINGMWQLGLVCDQVKKVSKQVFVQFFLVTSI